MSPYVVAACYGSAAVLALAALWLFGVRHWYWHVLSLAVALAVGLVRFPEPFTQPGWTLAIGWVFVFCMLWALAAPVVAAMHHPPRLHLRHH